MIMKFTSQFNSYAAPAAPTGAFSSFLCFLVCVLLCGTSGVSGQGQGVSGVSGVSDVNVLVFGDSQGDTGPTYRVVQDQLTLHNLSHTGFPLAPSPPLILVLIFSLHFSLISSHQ